MAIHRIAKKIGNEELILETGKLANLADGAVTVQCGETIVLVTAVSAPEPKEEQDFFPLTVDYREKAAAAGKFPGGYFKREGRPTEKEVLTSRMIDRPLRPLFPKGYFCDTQVIALLLSADGVNDSDILSINGASAALVVSDIPFAGPVGAVRVGRVGGSFVVNPTHPQLAESDLDLVYVGTENEILMFEGAADEISEADFLAAMEFAQKHVAEIIAMQKELAAKAGKSKREPVLKLVKEELLEIAYQVAGDRIEDALYRPMKVERQKAVKGLQKEVEEAILQKFPEATPFEMSQAFDYLQKKAFRKSIFEKKQRCDGRGFDDLRVLEAEVSVLPRSHGSAIFARGETKALCLATLAALTEVQEIDGYTGGNPEKRFILHYNFPPFSVGETGRTGSPGRREIGHGALAERSIAPVIPPEESFAYAIRVSSEIMESNGSTSMATVCAGSLALMDAGVKLKAPVGGISIGLVTENDESGRVASYQLLTDIIGSEDHFGDMDCKIAGTRNGITGFQLDLKLPGVSFAIMKEALQRAHDSRLKIIDKMEATLQAPREALSRYAPRIVTLKIDPDKIGLLIGPGGKNIKALTAETGTEINIEDDGTVSIYSADAAGLNRAEEIISGMTAEIEVGKTYNGKVVTIKEFGAFVEVLPGKDGLVHISELAETRINRVEDVVREGDSITVKCIGVDDKGRVKLSRRAVLKEKAAAAATANSAS
ncbi:MAG: polyribonucleotide nucleotidyltransferase [Verrucomicrobiae bacterium]|nr:polyribonucleotide nucleotidyltransferase [Verrucomicrobiae bacterium]